MKCLVVTGTRLTQRGRGEGTGVSRGWRRCHLGPVACREVAEPGEAAEPHGGGCWRLGERGGGSAFPHQPRALIRSFLGTKLTGFSLGEPDPASCLSSRTGQAPARCTARPRSLWGAHGEGSGGRPAAPQPLVCARGALSAPKTPLRCRFRSWLGSSPSKALGQALVLPSSASPARGGGRGEAGAVRLAKG